MFDSRRLRAGDRIVLCYNFRGGTAPPDRVVCVNFVDSECFSYEVWQVWSRELGRFIPLQMARALGMRLREGRRITHGDFAVNMSRRTRMLEDSWEAFGW